MARESCVFCAIVAGRTPAHLVDQDEHHLAFLTIYPNRLGQTVVIPKEHLPSDVFALPPAALAALVLFAQRVAARLARVLGAERVCLVAEGTHVAHAHLKLYPLTNVRRTVAEQPAYHDGYDGYIDTLEGPRADDGELAELAARLRDWRPSDQLAT